MQLLSWVSLCKKHFGRNVFLTSRCFSDGQNVRHCSCLSLFSPRDFILPYHTLKVDKISGRDEQTRPSRPTYRFFSLSLSLSLSGASFVVALGGEGHTDSRLWWVMIISMYMGTRKEEVVNQRDGRWMVCEEMTGKVVYSRTNTCEIWNRVSMG